MNRVEIKKIFTLVVLFISLLILVGCEGESQDFENSTTTLAIPETIGNNLIIQEISDITSMVYRIFDEDYGIVLYIVETYGLATAPSISGVRIGEIKVVPINGVTQITKGSKIYRLVDMKMKTVSYIVDTHGLATSPTIETFSFK